MSEKAIWFEVATTKGWEPVAGAPVGALVVHRRLAGSGWGISHAATGMGLGVYPETLEAGIKLAQAIDTAFDWTGISRASEIGLVNYARPKNEYRDALALAVQSATPTTNTDGEAERRK